MDINQNLLKDDLYFIFVNPSSGGNLASKFTEPQVEFLRFADPKALISVYNLYTQRDQGMEKLGKVIRFLEDNAVVDEKTGKPKKVTVLAAGGDGTVMWTIELVGKAEIDFERVNFGVIPYGTGNDFSRALKWVDITPSQVFDADMTTMKKLLSMWSSARATKFDIWNVDVELQDSGRVMKIDSKNRKKVPVAIDSQDGVKVLSKPMANYFSMGAESKIGIGFDRNRSTSALKNKVVYAMEGMKKICCAKIDDMSQVIHSIVELEGQRSPLPPNCGLNPANAIAESEHSESATPRRQSFACDVLPPAQDPRVLLPEAHVAQPPPAMRLSQVPALPLALDIPAEPVSEPMPVEQPKTPGRTLLSQKPQEVSPLKIDRKASIASSMREVVPLMEETFEVKRVVCLNNPDQPHSSTALNVANISAEQRKNIPSMTKCVSVIAINIESFASGCDIWKAAKGKTGLKLPKDASSIARSALEDMTKSNQVKGDGKLEWVTFGSTLELGMEQMISGRGSRLEQGSGPYEVNFNRADEDVQKVYMQIDGEFYIVENPKRVVLRRQQQINVLDRNRV